MLYHICAKILFVSAETKRFLHSVHMLIWYIFKRFLKTSDGKEILNKVKSKEKYFKNIPNNNAE